MSTAPIELQQLGLLDWPTCLAGLKGGWMAASDVEALAMSEVLTTDSIDSEVAELTSAKSFDLDRVERLVEGLAAQRSGTRMDDVVRRWMLAFLLEIFSKSVSDEQRQQELEDLYAEFGFPEELRTLSKYNFSSEERAEIPVVGHQVLSPLAELVTVIEDLKSQLIRGRTM